MENQLEKMKAASIEELEKKIHDANHFATNALATISDLIHLNIATAQKSLENSNVALQEMLHASNMETFLSQVKSQSDSVTAASSEYSRHLAEIAHHAQESMSKSAHENMEEMTHRIQNFLNQMSEHAPNNTHYFESLKDGLENANATYSNFLQTMHDAFEGYQHSWQQSADTVEKVKKPTKRKTS